MGAIAPPLVDSVADQDAVSAVQWGKLPLLAKPCSLDANCEKASDRFPANNHLLAMVKLVVQNYMFQLEELKDGFRN